MPKETQLMICYADTINTLTTFETTNLSMDEYKKANPQKEILYAFNMQNEITQDQYRTEQYFNAHCIEYGFLPTDLNREFFNQQGHTCELVGLLPRNRKYKCRIFDRNEKKYYKVTPQYVLTGLANGL